MQNNMIKKYIYVLLMSIVTLTLEGTKNPSEAQQTCRELMDNCVNKGQSIPKDGCREYSDAAARQHCFDAINAGQDIAGGCLAGCKFLFGHNLCDRNSSCVGG